MRRTQHSDIASIARDSAADSAAHLQAAGSAALKGAGEVGERIADSLHRTSEEAAALGKSAFDAASEKAGASLAEIDRAVARNPVGALLAAAGVGLLIGLVTRR